MEKIIISAFAVINLAAVIYFWLCYRKSKNNQEEKIKQALKERDLQHQAEVEGIITRAKTDFLKKIGQEIRFPLNTIMGFNDLILSKNDLDQEVLENVSKMHDSGTALISLVDDILDFAKIECGKFELVPVDYELASIINSVIFSNKINMEFKPVRFDFSLDANLPSRLIGDDIRVKQVFNKILSNAFKYTRSGTVEWHIGFERKDKDFWLISKVKDSGMGMKKEFVEKLFSGIGEVGSGIDGMGLGLVITKEIVDMMDGTIEVESEYGKGSAFTVKIKQQIKDETPINDRLINKEEKNVKPVYNQMPYACVLVVDDMILNLEVAQSLMRPYGMRIDAAPSGKIALAKVMNQSTKYSAIFMDHMMPEMDGIEAVRKIRELNNDYAKNVPIIALTADAINEKIFSENGFNDTLFKPIDIMKLDAILKKWVRDESKET